MLLPGAACVGCWALSGIPDPDTCVCLIPAEARLVPIPAHHASESSFYQYRDSERRCECYKVGCIHDVHQGIQ